MTLARIDPSLKKRIKDIQHHLKEKYGWPVNIKTASVIMARTYNIEDCEIFKPKTGAKKLKGLTKMFR